MKEENILVKLTKMFITQNPKCTARDIYDHLRNNQYGLKGTYTPREISKIIRTYSNYGTRADTQYSWFNVEIIRETGKPLKYEVKR